MAKRLTEKSVVRLKIRPRAYTIWDAQAAGLGLKVTPAGRRIWRLQAVFPGHEFQTKRTLGQYPAMSLTVARAKAEEWRALVRAGRDPAGAEAEKQQEAQKQRRAAELANANTFEGFAEKYIAERANRRAKADAAEIRRLLIREWGAQPLHSIAPRDVRALIDKIKLRSAYEARTAWTHAVCIFKAAVHEELIAASPCASLDRRQLFKNVKIGPRQRVLNDGEIFALWRASGALGYPYGPYVRLLLLTGTRASEMGKATWSEFHPELRRLLRSRKKNEGINWAAVAPEAKVWTVPRERFKSDSTHIVPLSDEACAILETLPRFAGSDYLFTLGGERPVWFGHKMKRRLDARMLCTLKALASRNGDDPDAVKLVGWVLHDLRRVVRTALAALDVADHVAEMVLGHGRRGLQRVYDQHKYQPQIREALTCWAERLRIIVGPVPTPPETGKVVALRREAR
jgi:integrase